MAFITLNRPERMNAFGGRMRQEIVEVLEHVAGDREIRAVVITGAGRAFCTGGDVDEFASGEVQAISKVVSSERHAMCKAVLAINSMEKPVHRGGERHCCRRRLQPGTGLRYEDRQR